MMRDPLMLRSFNSVRSYYFRAQCAQIDRECREYGGWGLHDLDLESFRVLWSTATSQAVAYCQARAG